MESQYITVHCQDVQYIPRNMHTIFALLCFVVVIHWLIFPYPSGLLHWHCGNITIAPVPAKQPWWIWINTSCEFIMNDCITTTKQSTTKPCAYFLGYTVGLHSILFSTPRVMVHHLGNIHVSGLKMEYIYYKHIHILSMYDIAKYLNTEYRLVSPLSCRHQNILDDLG